MIGLYIVLGLAGLVLVLTVFFNIRVKKNVGHKLSKLSLGKKVKAVDRGRWYLLLSSSRCHQCSVMKDKLVKSNVNFTELSIEENLEAVKDLNIMGTPTTLIMNGDLIENIKTGIFSIK